MRFRWLTIMVVILALLAPAFAVRPQAAAAAGASRAGYVMLRLPHAVKELFEQWLEENAPLRKAKVLSRLRDVRDGELYDARSRRRHGDDFRRNERARIKAYGTALDEAQAAHRDQIGRARSGTDEMHGHAGASFLPIPAAFPS